MCETPGITGIVTSGQGRGVQFTSVDWVRRQCIEKLGMDPYPGTLNLTLSSEVALQALRDILATPGIQIVPPDPQWCDASCYPVLIDETIPAVIVHPKVEGYPENQVEVIASVHLRAALSLVDGMPVHLTYREKAL